MGNKIKFLGIGRQYKSIKKEIGSAIRRILYQGTFIGGKEVEKLEKEIAIFCNTKYAVSVNSGTDALFLSFKALQIRPEDEIITTPFTFIATAEIVANLGARPVFVDIDPRTFNIDPLKIEEKITKKTKAILPVHLFGQMANMKEIMKIAKKYKLYVVEDAAQAIGAKYNFQKSSKSQNRKQKWQMAGSIGDMGCFSFFPSKNLGAYGDGGMVVTNNKKLAESIRILRNHGSSPKNKYQNLILGINSRLDTIQAAILRVKLKYLEEWNRKRIKVATNYSKELRKIRNIFIPAISTDTTHTFSSYVIKVSKKIRNRLIKYLGRKDIPTIIYYPLPLHLQPAFIYLGYKKGDFPESEKAVREVLSLPIYSELERKEQRYIIQKIKEFYK